MEIPKSLILEPGKLIAWQVTDRPPKIVKADKIRDWMETANNKFPYRCLPMVIANQFGWDILNPVTFSAVWNGGALPGDVVITWPTRKQSNIPTAHFGEGVLTFTLGHLFQTPTGVNLYVKGSPNNPKDGIIALEGIVETDWSPATFTMNYRFTRKNTPVVFEAGESFCRVFPIPRFMTEYLEPEIRMIEESPELAKQHRDWRASRDVFNRGLRERNQEITKQGWQKDYFQGGGDLWKTSEELGHQVTLRQKDFEDTRTETVKMKDQIPVQDVRPAKINLGGREMTIYISNLEDEHALSKRSPDTTVVHATRRPTITSSKVDSTYPAIDGGTSNELRRIEESNTGDSSVQDASGLRHASETEARGSEETPFSESDNSKN